jgi:hypothetical protein
MKTSNQLAYSDDESEKQTLPKLGYSRREAGRILGVSVESIDRLTRLGHLNPSRALRCPIYALADLERFLKETSSTVLKGGAQ